MDEIKYAIHSKLKNIRIFSADQFQKNQEWISQGWTDLTRIWGAQFLSELGENVPKYALVLSDPSLISIEMDVSSAWAPNCNTLLNGEIVAQRIIGRKAAHDNYPFNLAFTDRTDPGNIIQSVSDKKYYYVDSEKSSFFNGGDPQPYFKKRMDDYDIDIWKFQYFIKKRFQHQFDDDKDGKIIFEIFL